MHVYSRLGSEHRILFRLLFYRARRNSAAVPPAESWARRRSELVWIFKRESEVSWQIGPEKVEGVRGESPWTSCVGKRWGCWKDASSTSGFDFYSRCGDHDCGRSVDLRSSSSSSTSSWPSRHVHARVGRGRTPVSNPAEVKSRICESSCAEADTKFGAYSCLFNSSR